jgi:hypothetical protein
VGGVANASQDLVTDRGVGMPVVKTKAPPKVRIIERRGRFSEKHGPDLTEQVDQ